MSNTKGNNLDYMTKFIKESELLSEEIDMIDSNDIINLEDADDITIQTLISRIIIGLGFSLEGGLKGYQTYKSDSSLTEDEFSIETAQGEFKFKVERKDY